MPQEGIEEGEELTDHLVLSQVIVPTLDLFQRSNRSATFFRNRHFSRKVSVLAKAVEERALKAKHNVEQKLV